MTRTFEDHFLTVISVNLEIFWQFLPIYVVWVSGLVLAWRRRHRHPRVSLVTFGVLAGFLLDSMGVAFLGTVLAAVLRNWGWSQDSAEMLLRGMGVIENFFVAALWILVLVAIFGERQEQAGKVKSIAEQGAAADRPRDERFFER